MSKQANKRKAIDLTRLPDGSVEDQLVTIDTAVKGIKRNKLGWVYTMSDRDGLQYVLFDHADRHRKGAPETWLLTCDYINVHSKMWGSQRECVCDTVIFLPYKAPIECLPQLLASLPDSDATIPCAPPVHMDKDPDATLPCVLPT